MTPRELLTDLAARGVTLTRCGDKLKVQAPGWRGNWRSLLCDQALQAGTLVLARSLDASRS